MVLYSGRSIRVMSWGLLSGSRSSFNFRQPWSVGYALIAVASRIYGIIPGRSLLLTDGRVGCEHHLLVQKGVAMEWSRLSIRGGHQTERSCTGVVGGFFPPSSLFSQKSGLLLRPSIALTKKARLVSRYICLFRCRRYSDLSLSL